MEKSFIGVFSNTQSCEKADVFLFSIVLSKLCFFIQLVGFLGIVHDNFLLYFIGFITIAGINGVH